MTFCTIAAAHLKPEDSHDPLATIRSGHFMPDEGVCYFEVTIEEDAPENLIGIGFCEERSPLDRIVR
jgi:hypothetical protein